MDYYIRSWDPDSTYPANPQEGDVCYTITLDQSWAPVAGVKNDNLVKEEVYQNGEWVEVGGGGGGGDLETATVHVVIDGVGDMSMFGSIIDTDLQRTVPNYLFFTSADIDVVLYKGTAQVTASAKGADIVTSGDVTYDSEDMVYIVTGECTFTVSGK